MQNLKKLKGLGK